MTDKTQKALTVFTPTYNRREKLKRLYGSLVEQTNKDFEWLIVDDGSDDGTDELILSFQNENKLDIYYIKQENGGKMRAHNKGAEFAGAPLFVCLDSDDYFTKTAVDDILTLWSGNTDESVAGIVAHKGSDESHVLYGEAFPLSGRSSLRGLYGKGFRGETTLCFRTELIKKYKFPEIEGENYVPEDVVYDRIDDGHEYLILDKILTVCELVSEGLTDRVELLREKNPTGWFIYYYQRSLSKAPFLLRLKYTGHYLRFKGRVDKSYAEKYNLPLSLKLMGLPAALALGVKGKL